MAVLGLGAMGSALARAFIAAGHPTTVWNRTPERATPLGSLGAAIAADPVAAVAAAPLVVINLLDRGAVEAVLAAAGSLTGRTIVNLTNTTPDDARRIAEKATAEGARYVDGTIMVTTTMIGTADALVLYSGDADAFATHRSTLAALGGELDFLGADPGRAAMHDLGMLDVFFAGMTAFLHASAMVGADGIAAGAFLPYAQRVLDVLRASLPQLATDVDAGTYPGTEDNLAMELAALEHIVATSRAHDLDPAVPELSRDLAAAAVAAGHGRDGYSRVVEILRSDQAGVSGSRRGRGRAAGTRSGTGSR